MANESTTASKDDAEAAFGPGRRIRWWVFIFVAVALSLWAQWLGPGVLAELRSEDGSEAVAALQVIPFFVVALGIVWRHSAVLLALFPISFLPGMVMLPRAEWEALATPGSLVMGMATFALYFVVASGAPKTAQLATRSQVGIDPGLGDRHGGVFKRFLWTRFAVMAFLFAVITYALFFDAAIGERLASVDDVDAMGTHHLFMVISSYFAWMIAVYMGALLPILNWEHHRRRSAIPAAQKQLLQRPRRLMRRVIIWLVVLFSVTVGFLFLY